MSSRTKEAMRRTLELERLRKVFRSGKHDRTVALDDVSVALEAGELLVLLGPSGCGKSTTLRSIAGLESPDQGTIRLGDEVVFDSTRHIDRPAERRDIGMVFQNFALWPHMTVEQIVRFPLKSRRAERNDADKQVAEALELVNCSELAQRRPGQLSGGQQQRIALARALAASPSVLLFDEPLSNLDAGLRADLRAEIDRVHRSAEFTGVYVTHDQVEALAVADRIAVMNAGRIVQIGRAVEVYRNPCDEWVAGFMGFTNRVVRPSRAVAGSNGRPSSAEAAYRFRPEAVEIQSTGFDGELCIEGTVVQASFVGHAVEYKVDLGGTTIDARTDPVWRGDVPETLRPGSALHMYVAPADVLAFGVAAAAAAPAAARQPEAALG